MLKHRIFTAVLLVIFLVWSIVALENQYFALMMALFVGQGAWEWSRLMRIDKFVGRVAYTLLVMAALFLTWKLVINSAAILVVLWLALIWWLGAFVLVVQYPRHAGLLDNTVFSAAAGLLVLVPAWCAVVMLHSGMLHAKVQGPYYVIALLALIAVADTSAYFGGRRWGKVKLAPQVSPGKSWEGVFTASLGVGVCATGAAFFLGYTGQGWLHLVLFVAFCVVTAAFSVLGDLTESMFKRHAGVKDSGNLLPGHGGVLDRIDSITAAAPVFLLGLLSLTGTPLSPASHALVIESETQFPANVTFLMSEVP